MPKLFIATPCYGSQLHAAYVSSLLETRNSLAAHSIEHVAQFEPNDSLVPRARCVLVARFLETDCDRMLFIDGDLGWKGDDVIRLLCALESEDIEVACGIYPRKTRELSFPVNFAIDADNCLTWHDETGYVEIKDAPTGFLMFKRSVIEKMISAYPERQCQFHDQPNGQEYALFDCFIDPDTRHYLSEDFGFSRLWQRIGGRIWADPKISLAHFGQWKYTGSIETLMLPTTPEKPQDIQGWMTDEELAFLSRTAAESASVVEVGSWKGRSTFALLSACKGPVYAVDHWRGSETEREGNHSEAKTGDVFTEFVRNVGHFPNLRVVRKDSIDAAFWTPESDMVFLDGSHDLASVRADIAAWRRKAKRIICGHDFNWPGVAQAVTEAFGEVETVGTIWMHRAA